MRGSDSSSKVASGASLPFILDAVSEAIFVLDDRRRVLICNRAARELFGEVQIGHDFVRVIRHPESLRCVDSVLNGEKYAQTEVTLSHHVETVCEIRVTALQPTGESDARVVVSVDDVSEIEEAERMRSDFVANVSHELRSPLTALSGFIETLQGPAREDPEAQKRFLDVMEREALRMDRLIDDLLSLSKVETTARVRPTERVDLHKIIERNIESLTLQARERGKSIRLEAQAEVPTVRGDRDQLLQVFQNLIENAIKYSAEETEIRVTITVEQDVPRLDGAAVRVSVADKGSGIPRAHIPRLTERFYRVDDGRARSEGGTGLGLAIVKHIVSRHRGRLQITSEVGRGSIFSVYLPVEKQTV